MPQDQEESLEKRIAAKKQALEKEEQERRAEVLNSQITDLRDEKEKLMTALADFKGGYEEAAQNLPEHKAKRSKLQGLQQAAREVGLTEAATEQAFRKEQANTKEVKEYFEARGKTRGGVSRARSAKESVKEVSPDINFSPGVAGREQTAEAIQAKIEDLDRQMQDLHDQTSEGIEIKDLATQIAARREGKTYVELVTPEDFEAGGEAGEDKVKKALLRYHGGQIDEEVKQRLLKQEEKGGITQMERFLDIVESAPALYDEAKQAVEVFSQKQAELQSVLDNLLDTNPKFAETVGDGYRGENLVAVYLGNKFPTMPSMRGLDKAANFREDLEKQEQAVNVIRKAIESDGRLGVYTVEQVPDLSGLFKMAKEATQFLDEVLQRAATDPMPLANLQQFRNEAVRMPYIEMVHLPQQFRNYGAKSLADWQELLKARAEAATKEIKSEGEKRKIELPEKIEKAWAEHVRRLEKEKAAREQQQLFELRKAEILEKVAEFKLKISELHRRYEELVSFKDKKQAESTRLFDEWLSETQRGLEEQYPNAQVLRYLGDDVYNFRTANSVKEIVDLLRKYREKFKWFKWSDFKEKEAVDSVIHAVENADNLDRYFPLKTEAEELNRRSEAIRRGVGDDEMVVAAKALDKDYQEIKEAVSEANKMTPRHDAKFVNTPWALKKDLETTIGHDFPLTHMRV